MIRPGLETVFDPKMVERPFLTPKCLTLVVKLPAVTNMSSTPKSAKATMSISFGLVSLLQQLELHHVSLTGVSLNSDKARQMIGLGSDRLYFKQSNICLAALQL